MSAPWRWMLGASAAIVLFIFFQKILFDTPRMEYLHLVVDYHFGFVKRGLVGEILSHLLPVVPMWFVFALGGVMWLIALFLFIRVFHAAFGFSAASAPLLVMMIGSPAFFKNYMLTLGYFDIYGCIWALTMLLLPARSFLYVVVGVLGCAVLLMVHHLQMLLYVPTIAVIIVARYYFHRPLTAYNIGGGVVLLGALGALFLQIAFNSAMPVPLEELAEYVRTRALDESKLEIKTLDIWYRPLASDIALTRMEMSSNLLRLPIYLALIALHWPLIAFGKSLIAGLENIWHRRLMALAPIGVTIGYLIIANFVHDYARWFSSWGVCMFLLLFAVKLLPARHSTPLVADTRRNRLFGLALSVLPRVGSTKPF